VRSLSLNTMRKDEEYLERFGSKIVPKLRMTVLLTLLIFTFPLQHVKAEPYVIDHKFCKSVMNKDPYDPIDVTSNVSVTDIEVYCWVKLGTLTSPSIVSWTWISPNGTVGYVESYTTWDPKSHGYTYWGWYVVWSRVDIRSSWRPATVPSTSIVKNPGTWKVQFRLDGVLKFEDQLTVNIKPVTIRFESAPNIVPISVLTNSTFHETASLKTDNGVLEIHWLLGVLLEVKVPPIVDKAENHRFVLKTSSSGTIDRSSGTLSIIPFNDEQIVIYYEEEYGLSIQSDLGKVEGGGWYSNGTVANFSVKIDRTHNSSILFSDSIVFVGWKGDTNQKNMNGSIKMDGPKKIMAVWSKERSINQPILLLGFVSATVSVTVLVTSLAFRLKKRSKKCIHSVTEERYEEYLAKLDNLRETGRISEASYLKLKQEYHKKSGRK